MEITMFQQQYNETLILLIMFVTIVFAGFIFSLKRSLIIKITYIFIVFAFAFLIMLMPNPSEEVNKMIEEKTGFEILNSDGSYFSGNKVVELIVKDKSDNTLYNVIARNEDNIVNLYFEKSTNVFVPIDLKGE